MTQSSTTGFDSFYHTVTVADGGSMPLFVARPTGRSNGAGLIVFQEAFGVNSHIRDVTCRFAREGYIAAAPALFHRTDSAFEGSYTDFGNVMPHMQALTEDGLSADIKAAFGWLVSPDGGKASQVGCIGYCLGGRASFLADATVPLRAAVSYYGGGIAPNTEKGSAGLLGRASDLHAPILMFWGGKDAHIGPEQIRAVDDALRAAGKEYTNVVFSQADHGFFCDERASFNPDAARESWALTVAFLSGRLQADGRA